MRIILGIIFLALATQAGAHSGGLDKQGCHAGSKPYHCHKAQKAGPEAAKDETVISGTITQVRDGDTIEIDGIAIRLAALNCPENDTQKGKYATKLAKQFTGLQALCELTGAKSYDRLVGYCKINDSDFGRFMMNNSACKVWEKYDVWDRY